MMTDAGFQRYLQQCRHQVEIALESYLPRETTQPRELHRAMRYAMLGGGKRVRPVLVYAAGRALGLAAETLRAPASAVELVHGYSLIHDDLPAMDDDDLRRGQPTCHRAFGEATAILAGDALQSLAFKVLATDQALTADAGTRLRMVEALARASGSRGMAGGQALDLAAVGQELSPAELENMHIHKTGALILASVRLGAMAAGEEDSAAGRGLDHYAKCIGLAFQVRDDILDVEGSTETLGKTQGKDQSSDKPTYPSLLGLDESRRMAVRLCREAVASLDPLDSRADPLRALASYIVDRPN